MDRIYMVVNKVKKTIIRQGLTQQEAWSCWQDCWMKRLEKMDIPPNAYMEAYTMGKEKNMQKYLK